MHNGSCPVLRLTIKDLIHVLYRHLNASDIAQALKAGGRVSARDLGSDVSRAGQFLSSTTTEDLKTLIMEALQEGNRLDRFGIQANGNYAADVTLDRIIGRERGGTLTKIVRIVVRPNGTLVSIFPV